MIQMDKSLTLKMEMPRSLFRRKQIGKQKENLINSSIAIAMSLKRLFARIKQFRRIATRYDKLASRFKSFFALVASTI
jgi:transposase